MKYIIRINGKLIEDCTPEERYNMDKAIAKSVEKHFGIIVNVDKSKYH